MPNWPIFRVKLVCAGNYSRIAWVEMINAMCRRHDPFLANETPAAHFAIAVFAQKHGDQPRPIVDARPIPAINSGIRT